MLGATLLFGTGLGIAFFMLLAHRTRNPALIAHVAATVVIADTLFTATAALLQPITGYALARQIGWPLDQGWIAVSLLLYIVTGLFWLPVVWIQLQLRNLARTAAAAGRTLAGALPPPVPPAGSPAAGRLWLRAGDFVADDGEAGVSGVLKGAASSRCDHAMRPALMRRVTCHKKCDK